MAERNRQNTPFEGVPIADNWNDAVLPEACQWVFDGWLYDTSHEKKAG